MSASLCKRFKMKLKRKSNYLRFWKHEKKVEDFIKFFAYAYYIMNNE